MEILNPDFFAFRVEFSSLISVQNLFGHRIHLKSLNTFLFFPFSLIDEAVECLWRSLHFRENVRQKLKDSLKAVNHSIDPENVESQVFLKSRSKDEYLELSARYFISFLACKPSIYFKKLFFLQGDYTF